MPSKLIEGVIENNYALMVIEAKLEDVIKAHFKKTREQPFMYFKNFVFDLASGFVMRKDHYLLKTTVDQVMSNMIATGIVRRLQALYEAPKCKSKKVIVLQMTI